MIKIDSEINNALEHMDDTFQVLPIRNTVLFPSVLMPVAVARKNSLKLVKEAHK
jgi:ATP-dependent Lon protease